MRIRTGLLIAFVVLALVVSPGCKKTPSSPDNGDSGLEFSGTITENGAPMGGVDVYLSWGASQKTTTTSDGKFSFKGLTSGSYIITPAKLGKAFSPSNIDVGSTTRKDLNFTAGPANYGTIEGTIGKNFTAKDQNGNTVSLNNYHGKVVLIDFTADWCGPCREKAKTADAFYKQYKDKGFMYILIIFDGSPASWATEYGLTFPVLDDNGSFIFNQWKTSGSIPLPHVLDRNLKIQFKKVEAPKEEYEAIIKKYL